MIHHKKLRWERQKQELDNRIQFKEQEFILQKAALEHKNNEVLKLKRMLESTESKTNEIMKKYEKEIEYLHEQLNKLKTDYVKMQKKQQQQQKQHNKTSQAVSSSQPVRFNTSITRIPASNSINNTSSSSGSNSSGPAASVQEMFQYSGGSAVSSTLNSAAAARILRPKQRRNSHNLPSNNNHKNTDQLESELSSLHAQLDEHKRKEIELYNERDKLNKLVDYYERTNRDLNRKLDDLNNRPIQEDLAKSSSNKNQHNNQNDLNNNNTNSQMTIDYYKQEMRKRDEHIK